MNVWSAGMNPVVRSGGKKHRNMLSGGLGWGAETQASIPIHCMKGVCGRFSVLGKVIIWISVALFRL